MSELAAPIPSAPHWSRQWQYPLLLASLALLAVGVWRRIPAPAAPTIRDELAAYRTQMIAGDMVGAHDELLRLLAAAGRSDAQRAELLSLLTVVMHGLLEPPHVPSRENAERLLGYLDRLAVLRPRADWIWWMQRGDGLRALGRRREAIDAVEQAIAGGAPRPQLMRLKVADWLAADGALDDPAWSKQLAALLDDERVEAADLNRVYRAEFDRLLEAGKPAEAAALTARTEPRWVGTPFESESKFDRIRCMSADGRADEAERALRELRNAAGPRDDIWAIAGTMLAQLELNNGQAGSALAMCEEVKTVYTAGPHFLRCRLGEAEALAALGRIDESEKAFAEVVAAVRSGRGGDAVAASPLRATLLAWGARCKSEGRAAAGLRLLELAKPLIAPADWDQRLALGELLADLHAQLAGDPAEVSDDARRRHWSAAADEWSALSQAPGQSEEQVADFEWRAIEAAERSADVLRTVRLLDQFVVSRPADLRRSGAMLRLGRLLQSLGRFAPAAEAFEDLRSAYPRTPDAAAAIVPLAGCLIAMGGRHAGRGDALLRQVVDETSTGEPLVDPRATEYADALLLLAERLFAAKQYEDAIHRLETFVELHPRDAREPAARFMLADAYRVSGRRLLEERGKVGSPEAELRLGEAASERLGRAAEEYERVVATLLRRERELAALDRVRLRAAWMNRADCLFDLGRYSEARRIYSEAAWRFDNEITSIAALMQVVHCHRQLGERDGGRATLARMNVLLRRMPDAAFWERPGTPGRDYWLAAVKSMMEGGMY